MAEGKNSFILYADLLPTVEKLTDKRAGVLFKTILRYVNDKNPEVTDLMVDLVFESVKQKLKRDLKEWDIIKKDRSLAGKMGNLKRWNIDLYERVLSGDIDIYEAENIAKGRKRSLPDVSESQSVAKIAVNVNDNDSVNVNENVKELLPLFSIEHCLLVAMKDDRWVAKNKVTEKDLLEFNDMLEGRGEYQKNPKDYKTHYYNWKAAGKNDKPGNQSNGTQMVM